MGIMNSNKMGNAQNIINELNAPKVKYIKKEAGLLEREKLSDDKIILAEDSRQILFG